MTEAEILDWEEMISINDKNTAQLEYEMGTFGDIISLVSCFGWAYCGVQSKSSN